MNSDTAVSPKVHYHIRWLDSGELDWERHDARIQAEEAAKQISRRDERYSVEGVNEEDCIKCATLVRDAKSKVLNQSLTACRD